VPGFFLGHDWVALGTFPLPNNNRHMTNPDSTKHAQAKTLETRVWELFGKKKVEQAIATCQELNRNFPQFASGWHTASQLALKIKNPSIGLTAIDRALAIEPQKSAWLLQKALCLAKLGQTGQLGQLVAQLTVRQMQTAYQCSTLAMLLTQLERRKEALPLYRKAISFQPDNAQHHYNAAVLQRSLGEIDSAEHHFDQAIKLNPADYEAYKVRSELRKQSVDKNHVQALERLLQEGIEDKKGRANICYALAKELEDLGEAERSFAYLKQGADNRRRSMQYNVQRDLETMAAIQKSYPAALFEGQIKGDSNAEAIFILGLPRTGTTLVERILASHTDVHSAGELNNFTVRMMQQLKLLAGSQMPPRDQLVALSARLNFAALGKDYIDSTRPLTGHTDRFIDKLPLNFLYTGLIHLALPNAKIINLKRHPLDTCYAIYKQLFIDGYPFSYDLEELGRYFIAYYRLMEHWNKVMPGVIHTIAYEELVADVEGESRRLLGFCGLKWQAQCLKFYESKEASTTASTVQVRQPVYQSSVAKWRMYENQLAPLTSLLEAAGIALDT